ncbi:uncharacterized protein LOC130673720 isoform X4 [Microplitis mediator]|uniref:uncharacterized protein LOC130673720 isoform X4 n=1 Tax=Microplitis mediator TaxID=375433 RepID=UPI002556DE55|nr:uncharacterized protein LOC130673720 isoform X4 [Microplitis mediator]
MTTREDIDAIPSKYYETIAHYILGLKNLSSKHDLSKPMLRLSVIKIYPLLILIYSVLIAVGVAANITMIIHISKNKLYRDPTYAFLINIAISDIIKCIIVLPITLAVLLIQNWVFGKFLCLSLAMIQDYKTEYFNGLGICLGNLIDDIQQYMRGLFLLTYIAPLTVTAYIYVKSSRELQNKEDPSSTIAIFQARRKDSSRHDSDVSANLMAYREGKCGSGSLTTTTATIGFSGYTANTYDLEIDVRREIRTQKYLIFMVSFYAILLCPLMVLKLAKLALVETEENEGHFDITYTMFVWLGFIPTVSTPLLYASWQMSRPTKERLKGYFQSSSRRLTKVCEEGVSISTRRSLHQNNIHSGLANVAYTQHPRTTNNSSNGSNEGEGIHCSPGNLSIRSAEFDNNNAQIMYLVR